MHAQAPAPCHPDPEQRTTWSSQPLSKRALGPTFTVCMGISTQRGQCPKVKQRAPRTQPMWGLPVLTARLGQCPHFIHVWLAVWPVHLHHDKVLVCACLLWVAGGGGQWKATPDECGLCRGAFQVRGRLDSRKGPNAVLGDQGQMGIQWPLGAGVGRGDRGVDGGGG